MLSWRCPKQAACSASGPVTFGHGGTRCAADLLQKLSSPGNAVGRAGTRREYTATLRTMSLGIFNYPESLHNPARYRSMTEDAWRASHGTAWNRGGMS